VGVSAASVDVEAGIELLRQLALDLRCCWNHATDEIWRELEPDLWARTHNPWVVVQTVSSKRLRQKLAQPEFQASLSRHAAVMQDAARAPAWFQQAHPNAAISRIAYFSMEFMLAEALPIYAGGLGNVAGDQLKAANDLGVPVSGVGLLYSQGYFRQAIGADGAQQALFPYNDPSQLPITPLRGPDGESLRLELALPGFTLWLRAWQVKVGRLCLYLLDSNDVANRPAHRGITSELYGGDSELRLQQELVLGIGGWRLLEVLGRLVDQGNTVVVIEHNLDVVKTADWIVDLGPEGGNKGGLVIAEGTPEQVAKTAGSYTGEVLKPVLARAK